MRCRYLAVLTVVAVLLPACGEDTGDRAGEAKALARIGERTVRSQPPRDEATTAVAAATLPRFSRRRAMRHVRRLSRGIGVRVRGTRGERLGARYVAERFRDLGYRVWIQRYPVDGRRSRNVVARWPGVVEHPFVIGGHIDTVRRSPGANDNASGVAVVLETARLVAGTPRARLIKFVGFGSEEFGRDGRHHIGSQIFVNRLGRRGRRELPGMISVDMIADGRPLLVGTSGIGPPVVARTLYRRIRRTGIGVSYRTFCDCSDNGPFERAGIPAAFTWSGDEPNYHDPSDLPRNMKKRDLSRTGRALKAFVKSLDRAMISRFRRH